MIQYSCISPIDCTIYSERNFFSFEHADRAIKNAREGQVDWAMVPLQKRIQCVVSAVELLKSQTREITLELAWTMGRPICYGGEIGGVIERTNFLAASAEKMLCEEYIENSERFERYIQRVPLGVVLIIAPWNYPYLTAINGIVAALISGNSVVFKPSKQTHLSGERIVSCLHKSGVPEYALQLMYSDHQLTEELISRRAFDAVQFTGSVYAGRSIEKAAAGTFIPTVLELGGKDPGYVMEDADIDSAVETLIDASFFNSGQCCCGIERIYIAENRFNEFLEKSIEVARGYKLGNPLDEATKVGPVATEKVAKEVSQQISEALAMGAKRNLDKIDFEADDGAQYVMPQILTNVDHSMRLMKEENFGPVVGLMPVRSDNHAVDLINDSRYGLTVSLWSQNIDRAKTLSNRFSTGTVFLNRADYLDPALCWTGCKDTGKGVSLSGYAFHSMTRPRSHHFRINR